MTMRKLYKKPSHINHLMQLSVRSMLIFLLSLTLLPITVFAAAETPDFDKPYEKVAVKQGDWYSTHITSEDEDHLIIGYRGSYDSVPLAPAFHFRLKEKTLLTGIFVPFASDAFGETTNSSENKSSMSSESVSLVMVGSQGNVYQGFDVVQDYAGGIVENSTDENGMPISITVSNYLLIFTPYKDLVLPTDDYTIYLENSPLPVDAFLMKGYHYAAYQKYEKRLQEWALKNTESEEDELSAWVNFGNEELNEVYQQYLSGETQDDPAWTSGHNVVPQFTLEKESTIDEIILSMWNGGQGAQPGMIRILNQARQEVASLQAQGGTQGNAANTLWVVKPDIVLAAGVYSIDIENKSLIDVDEEGQPVFHLKTSIPFVQVTSFSGTYRVSVDVKKTSTLMGPVNDSTSSFALQDHELVVLDKGDSVELITQYEGMPFSQNCTVLNREQDKIVVLLQFSADLTQLPAKARIAAAGELTLQKDTNDRIWLSMDGQGFYSRQSTKDKGGDENTYALIMKGNLVKKDLPTYVMVAIASVYGAGNIPGPDNPSQAAIGMLFPPLIGLIVSLIQGMLQPQELASKLSVGEQAMRDANRSLGKGLYTEEEANAWKTLGDALGASGGDEEDSISMGDNELPGGADYQPTKRDADFEQENFENEYTNEDGEDLSFGKPDVTSENPVSDSAQSTKNNLSDALDPLKQVSNEPEIPVEPESMVIQTGMLGSTTLITKDPNTGQWINSETGNPFDLKQHQENFGKQVKDYQDYSERNEDLERTGQSSMQQALDEIANKRDADIASIQKEIDKRRHEQLEIDQRSLEWEQQQAGKMSSMGRIIGDSIRNAGDEVIDLSKELASEAKEGLEILGETAKMTAKDLLIDQKQALKNIEESYNEASKTLGNIKDKTVDTAKKVWNNPMIVVNKAKQVGKSVIDTVTDPKKAWEFVQDAVGINDFSNSLNPNLSLRQRLKYTLSGTMKLGTTIGSAGTAGAAAKGAGKLVGLVDDVLAVGARRIPKSIKPSLITKTGPNYAVLKKAPNISGVTKTSRTIIQNTADDFGVQIKTRPTTASAEKWLNSGKAAPKPMQIKAKTINKMDELLGAPKESEGLVGYFKPTLPPKEVIRSLPQKVQKELINQYKDRSREYRNLADKMKKLEASGDFRIVNGRVMNKDGKFLTGDVDIYDVTNFDGTPVRDSVKKQVLDSLQKKKGSNVMHEDLMSWNKDGIDFSEQAKEKMIEAATREDKGVTSYNPLANPTAETYVRSKR